MLKKKFSIASVLLISVILISASNMSTYGLMSKNDNTENMEKFDFSKAVDLREDKEFASKYKLGRLQALNLSKNSFTDDSKKVISSEKDGEDVEHKAWGADIIQVYLSGTPSVMGVHAKHIIDDSLTLGSGEKRELFAPTLKGPKPCPLEASTVYYSFANGFTLRYFGIYDFSIGSWTNIDLTFSELDNEGYLDQTGGMDYYEVVIWYDSSASEWNVYLWDFDSEVPVLIYSQDNDNNDHGGWDFYEGYYYTSWPETPYLRAFEITVYRWNWAWNWVNNVSPYGGIINVWNDLETDHAFNNNYYDWYVGE